MAKQGGNFETAVKEIFESYGYIVSEKKSIRVYENQRPWQLDLHVAKGNKEAVIEIKVQKSSGSCYEKVDFGCRKLTKVAKRTKANKAMVVYGGSKMQRFMASHPLAQEMKRDYSEIEFISIDDLKLKLMDNGCIF